MTPVRLEIGGVEIIPSSDSRDAWDLAFLIRACLATEGMQSPVDIPYIEHVQRSWLKLPPGPTIQDALIQFVLGLDASTDDGIFSEDPMQRVGAARAMLAKRAAEILSSSDPAAFIKEQVLYATRIKEGPLPSDLAMLRGGAKEVCGLDAIVQDDRGETIGTAGEIGSLNAGVAFDLGLTLKELKGLVSELRSGTNKERRLADVVTKMVQAGALAPNGADKDYQLVHRNKKKLQTMAKRLRASKEVALPLVGGIVTRTIIGEYVLSTTSKTPVVHSGNMGFRGLTFRPANMTFDERKPTPKPKRRPS